MTSPLSIPEIAGRMAEAIRRRGWNRGWFSAGDGPGAAVCMAGAFNVACGREPDIGPWKDDAQSMGLRGAVNALLGRPSDASLSSWNDAQTSAEPVLAVLDAVASGGGA